MNKKSGFTLIELVIVIVILGILAAAAIPRFTDLASDARISSVNGLAGALRSAASIAHATQLAKGYASNVSVSLEGTSITMSRGYPVASNISISLADATLAGFTHAATSDSIVRFTVSGRSAPDCTVEYNDSRADTHAGSNVSTTTGGC